MIVEQQDKEYENFTKEYEQGVNAKARGLTMDDCPYPKNWQDNPHGKDGQRKWWHIGFLDKTYEKHHKKGEKT